MSDLLPPHDLMAEQAVLGSVLLSAEARTRVAEVMGESDLYRPIHQAIYRSVDALQREGQAVDIVTVAADLERRGELERIGTGLYLVELQQSVPTAVNASYYAEIVAAKAVQRRLIEAGTRIVQMGYTAAETGDVPELVSRAKSEMESVASANRTGDVVELVDLLPDMLDELAGEVDPGYPTGFPDLDEVLGGGLHPGTLTVIGARPGVGKSILCLQIAAKIAADGRGALMFSLEMSRSELMGRFLSSEAAVELSNIHGHKLSTDDWRRLDEAAQRAKAWPLAVADIPRIGLAGISARSRERAATPRGLVVVVVDYLQLVAPADSRAPREQQVAGLSRGLKLLARELGVAVVAAAQLNRGSEQRADRKPGLTDLRESGGIEADADTVLLLHDNPETTGEIEVIVSKNRHGPRTSVRLMWAPHYARARPLARSHYSEEAA